ncbi:ABC transporter permease [Pseudonocardia oceani]|uniref:Xylose transport system permease protein XylH n=2 Tax=Pseudonocardia oceani TaxID=2792013 RepID=A0ABS6UI64_9PSEU|nr:ABC transporter permease [Pseudonocardia oceani]MBW0108607.1 ABC transporter permease [Pseudonocardia oceani]MBW0121883.1 ABC transporter permease [Pseudonocardia oceani]MBW0131952.1 ABC transporter permease [Pseudonocardia oceani]
MTTTLNPTPPPSAPPAADERVARVGLLRRLVLRPEIGSLIGAVILFVLFAVSSTQFYSLPGISNWLDPASLFGIMAVAVAMLMIGGHFDLSAGVLTGTAGLATAVMTTQWGLNIWVALLVSLVLCLGIGFVNGYLVTRTGLPSFIITLATFLMLQGLNLAVTKLITGTVSVGGMSQVPYFETVRPLFASRISLFGVDFKIQILWWVLVVAIGAWVLAKTRFGNWTFAVGGDPVASRNIGVPAARTTITLFMGVGACAWLVGSLKLMEQTSVQTSQGFGEELIYIVAAVIGGCLLTGGYGSVIGAAIGALIFGMTSQGIVYAGLDSDWFKFFLGAMLLLAVLANQYVRRYAERSGR